MIECTKCNKPIVKKNGIWKHLGRNFRHPAVPPEKLPLERKLSLFDIEFRTDFNTDCGGGGFSWRCPDCGESISWAPGGWWDLECSCRDWDFEISVVGELKKEYR